MVDDSCGICGKNKGSSCGHYCDSCNDADSYVDLQYDFAVAIHYRDRINSYELSDLTIDDGDRVFRFTPEQSQVGNARTQ